MGKSIVDELQKKSRICDAFGLIFAPIQQTDNFFSFNRHTCTMKHYKHAYTGRPSAVVGYVADKHQVG